MAIHLHTHSYHVPFTSVLDIRCKDSSSIFDCIKKCFQAIWEFIQRMFSTTPVEAKRITMDDVDNIVISHLCAERQPCMHKATVFLKDGRNATGLHAYDICSIVNRIAKDRINMGNNPENTWVGDVVEHFKGYAANAKPAEEVLNRIFPAMI